MRRRWASTQKDKWQDSRVGLLLWLVLFRPENMLYITEELRILKENQNRAFGSICFKRIWEIFVIIIIEKIFNKKDLVRSCERVSILQWIWQTWLQMSECWSWPTQHSAWKLLSLLSPGLSINNNEKWHFLWSFWLRKKPNTKIS